MGESQPSKNAKIHENPNSKLLDVKIGSFCTTEIPEIDFTENLSDRKLIIFPHCANSIFCCILKGGIKSDDFIKHTTEVPKYLIRDDMTFCQFKIGILWTKIDF